MFLRKLTVIVVPLLLCLMLCLMLPALGRTGDAVWALCGGVLGLMLSLVLPASGASRQREPFAGLLWIPALILVAVIVYQYLLVSGAANIAFLNFLYAGPNSQALAFLVESAFAGFLITTCLRTRR